MAIGPDARLMIPGRVLVIAFLYAMIGLGAIVLGLGPILRPSGEVERLVAYVAIAAGTVLGAIGGLLFFRGRRPRRLGILGGAVVVILGQLIVILAGLSGEDCATDGTSGCTQVVLAVGVGGLVVSSLGIISTVTLYRLRPSAWADRARLRRR